MGRRLLMVVNDPAFFLSHRLPVAVAATKEGYEVHVATAAGPSVSEVIRLGFIHHVLPLSRSGANPVREILSMIVIYRLFRRVRPDLVHLVTIKPVLYGGIAARLAGVPAVVVAVSGLGFIFIGTGAKEKILRKLVCALYRLALGKDRLRVIFQNPADRETLQGIGAVSRDKAVMIRGSGVDLSHFSYVPEPQGGPVVVMVSRLLRDKGVFEFVEAARLLNSGGFCARFRLIGEPDVGNPASVHPETLSAWVREGIVECAGFSGEVNRVLAEANLVVLPSYREGLPKVLLEAAASGRAVVTTDVPGCRDAIEPEVTGVLVPMRDAVALAAGIRRLLDDSDLRQRMGAAARLLAEREFGVEKVVAQHLEVYRTLENGDA